ncbi:MAG: DNA translocase FtsK [Treponema sp.]|nr:DNA translocase FtsK [Treponema sp.]
MKNYRILQILTGIVFFIIAALLSFCLLFSLFDNGIGQGGIYEFMCILGSSLESSYGLCSILVPVFFFVVSMILFVAKITFKKCIYISFSLVPFFTAVISEKIYRSSPHEMAGPIEVLKLILTIAATIIIMAIEYLVSGIIAEKIAYERYKKLKYGSQNNDTIFETHDEPAFTNDDNEPEEYPGEEIQEEPDIPDFNEESVEETQEELEEEIDIPVYNEDTVQSDPSVMEAKIPDNTNVNDIFSQMDREIQERLENGNEFIHSESKNDSEKNAEQNIGNEIVQKSVKEAEAEIREEKKPKQKRKGPYKIPTDGLLDEFEDQQYWIIDNKTNAASAQLKETLEEFKIAAEVTGIRKGPVVTMFEILPAPGVKLSKIVQLADNIALRLAASSIRIVAPIPGKRAVGIEVPNENRAIVTFRELIEQNLPEYKKMAIPVVLGKDIQGEAQLLDIAKTPHLLIAGSTGSGKSVCVNSIILSILYKRTPEQVKLILVDPKIVELKLYNDIPHLLTPVITEPKKALQSLQYCLCEMERRYALLDGLGVRDIINYNKRVEERHIATEKLPYIVVIIDEFADLMATTGKELESTIARLCAMSRAVGIHLVLATQRPSIDVITGLIKANIPTRIAFMVASKMDSRIIIDQVGAEKLLGRGDMLYASATDPFPVRIQGTYVSDDEVENVVEYVKGFGEPEYIDEEIFVEDDEDELGEPSLFGDGDDPLYDKALGIVLEAGKASASYIQRRLKVGYNRAARLVEEMEARGIVGPANGSKPREIIHMP